ncbi:hypothetical protein B0F90DRAFT_1808800 [Multifurca ochricompacta]|uniref:Uncharacterized protein n=1 Tax=Multifurca ochricompacta TaxID=376703 RepID=A0AAD4M8K1_9AGAM|nr:hypothetical protein B0F90DRAFT_1808800 [Multifurca ochricompacta]
MTALLHLLVRQDNESTPIITTGGVRHANPVVAFIIGLSIITLASVLNAAGLNLTKLDHVRSSAVPKSARKRDWLRPLWLLGMLLYILSQLIGSTLALEYMRAEYVAPLGSTSLIFNFLFARFLVGTPVTSTDIYGTVIVILGVVGIVAFGSINTGLSEESSAAHLAVLWGRVGWIGYFIVMSLSLALVYIFATQLDLVLSSRSDLSAQPFAGMSARIPKTLSGGLLVRLKGSWSWSMIWIAEKLEEWTAGKDDKVIAWTLGIGWACAGGGLAGECLVFAKAAVKLISGSLSHENTGNQLGHLAPILTFIFLAFTAVLQIVFVPVFYGVYTATGWLNSLVILILISGVVLLTHKKPEPAATQREGGIAMNAIPGRQVSRTADGKTDGHGSLHTDDHNGDPGQVVWDLAKTNHGEEGEHLMASPLDDRDDTHSHTVVTNGRPQTRRRSTSSVVRRDKVKNGDDEDGFGDFSGA